MSTSGNEVLVDGETSTGWWLVTADPETLRPPWVVDGSFPSQTDARWGAPEDTTR